MGVTSIGAGRELYGRGARLSDPRPSRFTGTDAYTEWAARADRAAPYLASLPAAVVELSGRASDAVLLATWETVDAAHTARTGEAVEVPDIGTVSAGELTSVWGWLVDVIKSRHTAEWESANDREYAVIESRAAVSQGVAVGSVDWDAVPDDYFDGKSSALALAVATLRAHVG